MSTYTVVLLYPDYLADDWPFETWTDEVRAASVKSAINKARRHARSANKDSVDDPTDFKPFVVYEGSLDKLTLAYNLD